MLCSGELTEINSIPGRSRGAQYTDRGHGDISCWDGVEVFRVNLTLPP